MDLFNCSVVDLIYDNRFTAEGSDLAANKAARSVESNMGYETVEAYPSRAVDGNWRTCMTTSLSHPYPWFAVDLGQAIKSAFIYVNGVIEKNGKWRRLWMYMDVMSAVAWSQWVQVMSIINEK